MSCPWAKIVPPEPVNFADILSEEAAKDTQSKEDTKQAELVNLSLQQQAPDISQLPPGPLNDEDGTCDSDEVIARMLQKQFDAECNMLKRTISFSNYRRGERHTDLDSESEDENDLLEDPSEKKYWDRLENLAKEFSDMPVCGYRMQQDGLMITKQDIATSGRRKACKMMDFPPDFHTGDGAGLDLKMSNEVLNSLKIYSSEEQARPNRLNNNKFLERVNGVISIGKEAVIIHADGDTTYPHTKTSVPKECVLKVFKTILSEFKQPVNYIMDDYRLKGRMGKQTIRKIYHSPRREMHNLYKLKKVGIPCPEVIMLKRHVLVMSFIGENRKAAPKLKDADLDEREYEDAYNQVVSYMKTLYHDARLIHADLSECNILWHNGKCYFIDVSQSTKPGHIGAFSCLMSDCENVSNFFARKGVQEVKSGEQLFFDITGCYYNDRVALEVLLNKAI